MPPFFQEKQQLEKNLIIVHKFMIPYFTTSLVYIHVVLRVNKDCANEAVFLLNKSFSKFKCTPAKPDSIFRDMHALQEMWAGKGARLVHELLQVHAAFFISSQASSTV